MLGANTGNSSAAETPFGGIKESGIGRASSLRACIATSFILEWSWRCNVKLGGRSHASMVNIRGRLVDGACDSVRLREIQDTTRE